MRAGPTVAPNGSSTAGPSDAALRAAEAELREVAGDRVAARFPLAPLTTFRLGGPAALYLEAESDADLAAAGRVVGRHGLPFFVLGKGSNILVADAGFPGLVVRLGRGFRYAALDGTQLVAGAAMPLPRASGVALQHELSGLEFGVAIPATVGGAVRMNAGAHGRELAEVLVSFEVFDLAAGRPEVVPAASGGFAYRRSGLTASQVVVSATFGLERGGRDAIRALMDEARRWRRDTQPLNEPNCGSVFKNPPGDHAARLVDAAGAKGLAVGGAQVSTKHSNFIVAAPGATARDVRSLIDLVRARVAERSGVRLETEVHLVGDFSTEG